MNGGHERGGMGESAKGGRRGERWHDTEGGRERREA